MFIIKIYDNDLEHQDSTELLIRDSDEETDHQSDPQSDSPNVRLRTASLRIYTIADRALIGLFALFIAVFVSLEVVHFTYSSTYYQFIALHISAKNAAEILSVMSTAYTVGRCLSGFIALKVIPRTMIIYHLLIIILAMAILYYGQHSVSLIWTGNIVLGKYVYCSRLLYQAINPVLP